MIHFAGKAAKVLTLSLLTALLLTVSAFAAEEGLAQAAGITTGAALRMRTEPSTESSVVTQLNKDVIVAVLDSSIEGWYQVAYAGKSGYVSADYLSLVEGPFETYGRISGGGVNVRDSASTEGGVVTSLEEGAGVTVTGLEAGWYTVSVDDTFEGYIRSDYVNLTNSAPAGDSTVGSVVELAKQYLGTRYAYGGASPSGFDCSGFTMYIFSKVGYSLPHSATSQWQSGLGTRLYSVSELQPGDLVFFCDPSISRGKACSHAGIYVGGGQMIHSSSPRSGGVIYSDLYSGYYSRYFVGGIRL